MRIVHIASEFAPLAKVGGMSDVLLGLARKSQELGHDVLVVLPKYGHISWPCEELDRFSFTYDGKQVQNRLYSSDYEGVSLHLIEPENGFFASDTIYGAENDADRFAYFCAAATALLESKEAPDVVHLHDWHTALVAKLYSSARTILTIHNLAYIGGCSKETLHKIGLMELSDFVLEDHYSLLRGGLVAADLITTVSPTYAEEILTKPFGGPFCQLLNGNRDKLVGILNGIDYSYWNPQRDEFLPFPYSSAMLSGKDEMKRMIQTKLDMPKEDNLLVTAIARLVEQKGPDLIEAAIRMTERRGGQFVLLGSASDPKTQEQFASLKKELAHNPNISLQLLYDEELAHQLFAAADLLIVPSLFEPCGLTQMIAMRYGTLPLVRKTGGLADTVIDGVDGFVFEEASSEAIEACLTRCFALFNSEKWTEMQSNALSRDWSWTIPTQTYLSHYQNLALR